MKPTPTIYLFLNTYSPAMHRHCGVAMTEDGHTLIESMQPTAQTAMTVLIASGMTRFWERFPKGFTLEMIPLDGAPSKHAGLTAAIKRQQERFKTTAALPPMVEGEDGADEEPRA